MTPECAAFREVAPELALGIVDGDERAAALDHLAGCEDCRTDLAGLTASVDALLQAVPEAEPSSGFEVRALAAFEPVEAPAGSPWRRRAAVAAAAAVALGVLAIGVRAATSPSRPRPSVEEARSPSSPTSASLTDPDGNDVGTVRVDRRETTTGGSTSALVVSVDGSAPEGTYRVECDYESGRPYRAGVLEVGPDGVAGWRATVSVPTYDLRRVRLVSTDGSDNLEAEFPA